MATMNFIKGTFTGKFGQFVGSSWKGKSYVRTFTQPSNPRTPDQVAIRTVFAHIAHIAKGVAKPLLRPYTFPRPQKQTEYNVFMHINQPLFADKVWDPAKLKLFEGPLFNPGLDGAVYDAGEQWVTVYWDNADGRGEDVQRIGRYAFACCYDLAAVTIPASVKVIDTGAFERCGSLTNVSLPSGLTAIGSSAFSGCDKLTSITIPSTVIAIAAGAFSVWYERGFTSITMPTNIAYVAMDAASDDFGAVYNGSAKKAGTYTFKYGVWYVPAAAGAPPPSMDIVLGKPRNSTLQGSGIPHLYRVALPSGPVSLTAYTESNLNTEIRVYDADGNRIAYNNGHYEDAKVSTLVPAGTVYIRVSVPGDNWDKRKGAGPYALQVSTGIPQDIAPGTVHNATLQAGIPQYYRVALPSGPVVLTAYTESNLDTEIRVYDAAGKQIAYDNDSGSGRNAKVRTKVPAGTVYIQVSGRYSAAGPYALQVSTEAAP